MQTTPALPWDAETGGTIQLAEPVSFADLVAGKIIITAETKDAHQQVTLTPTESEDDVFYMHGDNEVCSIAKFTSSSDSLVVTEGAQAENYIITGIRLGEPIHQFEVYANPYQIDRPVMGEKYNTLYVAINKDVDSAKNFSGETDYQKLSVTGTPGEFTLNVYVDFASESGSLEKGQLIECTVPQLIEITSEPLCSFGDIVYV